MIDNLEVALRWLGTPHGICGVENTVTMSQDHSSASSYLPSSTEVNSRSIISVVVLCGSAVLSTIHDAFVLATTKGTICPILVTGGIGHSTTHLIRALVSDEANAHREQWIPNWNRFLTRYNIPGDAPEDDVARLLKHGRSEASWISEILALCFEFPEDNIWLEEESTNCGANAQMTLQLLPEKLDSYLSRYSAVAAPAPLPTQMVQLLIIQDPTMQRRSILSFLRHMELLGNNADHLPPYQWCLTSVDTNAAQNKDLTASGVAKAFGYNLERLVSLVVGEHQRLVPGPSGYGPLGKHFIADGGEIPPEVEAAFVALKVEHGVDGRTIVTV
ncbi:GPI-anchored surface protein, putative [Bodo saltans]|uniref:GPI-anchored surface protein, putative n=1 Tax=Bodo saltans TaxID=75058 RepID=A0A0S4J9H8_BODSA|nr:GPI-anchored surface protein, putative [Bodo saltans]|eukprot:CUG86782.1 GPI-anchored surface protein, putative [Bodo saltans]